MQAVVCTNMGLAQAQRIDAFCAAHSPPIPFVYGNTRGVFAQVFCDFGPSFTVFDVDGATILPSLRMVVRFVVPAHRCAW